MAEEDNKAKQLIDPAKALKKTALNAVLILLFDLFIMGAPTITVFVVLYLLFYLLPRTLFSLGNPEKRKYFGYKTVVYLVLIVSVIGVNQLEESYTRKKADRIISAVEKYHDEQNRYPGALHELVPGYLEQIPSARTIPTLLAPVNFFWLGPGENPHLMYVVHPPFGRMSWSFRDNKWISID